MLRNAYLKNPLVLTIVPLAVLTVAAALGVDAQQTRVYMVLGGMLAIAGAVAHAICVDKRVRRPVAELAAAIAAIRASRDLTHRVRPHGSDEAVRSIEEFNALMEMVQSALRQSSAKSLQFTAAAAAAAQTWRRTLADCREQGIAATAAATASRDISAAIDAAATSTRETSVMSLGACRLSEQSKNTARETSSEMARIADSVSESAQRIESLSMRSNEIDGIVKVIKDIAEQTNMLALNAAIEAARAGEQGRGFAVVADEVRKLAERTATATSEISQMIATVQTEITAAVESLSAGNAQVSHGVTLAQDVAGALAEISAGAQSTCARADETADAMRVQGAASAEVATAIERIARHVAGEADRAGQSAAVAGRLEHAARELHAAVGAYTA